MSAELVYSNVRTRLLSDTDTGGLFKTGARLITSVYDNFFAETADMPFLVYTLVNSNPLNGFTIDVLDIHFDITLYIKKGDSSTARAGAIMARVLGNGNSPSYGLHRWRMGAIGTFSGGIVALTNQFANHDKVFSQYVHSFHVQVSR